MILWLLATGTVSILGQVVLLRELNVAFYGSELIYILAFGIWLFWSAAGVAVGRRSYLPRPNQVRLLLVVLAPLLPLCVMLVRGTHRLWGGVPGAYLSFPVQLAAMALALLPVGFLLGLLFQWVAKLYVSRGRTLAAAYAIESAGGLIGGVLATLFLVWGVRNWTAGLVCGLFALAAACVPWNSRRPRWLAPAAIVLVGLLSLALVTREECDRWLTAWNHPHLVASRDTPYGRVTVTELSGQIAVFENGALSYESEGTSAEEFVQLAALQRSTLESVLVLGGGAEGVVREILRHRPRTVDYVELNGLLLDLLLRYLPADLRDSLDAAPVRIVQADPRSYLRDSPRYDLVLVGMPEPASGQSNRFYTREFFALCAERLNRGGVLAFRLRSAENLWTPQLLRRTASIHRALQDVFADVVVLPGVTNIVLAADVPLSRDPVLLADRFTARGIEARLVSPAYIDYLYTNDRFAETAALLAGAVAPVNSDVNPVCYQYTLLIWLANFFPVLAWLDLPELGLGTLAHSPWAWSALAVAMVSLMLSRRSRTLRRVGLVAAAGFAGMVLETALILNYQTSSGVLYQNLGLLLTLFMAGLALGAGVLDRLDARGLPAGTGVALMVDFVLLSLLSAWLLNSGWVGSLAATALLLLGCGFLVAAVFAYVSLRDRPDQRLVVSPLYAADLLGGCFASLLASLLLIPVLGLAGSALAMALLLVLVFVLV